MELKYGFGKKKFRTNGRSILLIMTHNLVRILLFIKLISLKYLLAYYLLDVINNAIESLSRFIDSI